MGKASVYLPICLMPAGSGKQEGTFWGLVSMNGQEKTHSFAQDMLHIQKYTPNQHPRQAKENFLDQDTVSLPAVTHRNRICYTRSCL